MHKEHTRDGSVLVDLLHHRLGTVSSTALLADAVTAAAIVLAAAPAGTIVHALLCTGRCRLVPGAVLVVGRGTVVRARLKLVGVAHGLVTIVATVNNASCLVVGVDSGWNATAAAHVSKGAAAGHILSREMDLLLALAGNADAICHGFN